MTLCSCELQIQCNDPSSWYQCTSKNTHTLTKFSLIWGPFSKSDFLSSILIIFNLTAPKASKLHSLQLGPELKTEFKPIESNRKLQLGHARAPFDQLGVHSGLYFKIRRAHASRCNTELTSYRRIQNMLLHALHLRFQRPRGPRGTQIQKRAIQTGHRVLEQFIPAFPLLV